MATSHVLLNFPQHVQQLHPPSSVETVFKYRPWGSIEHFLTTRTPQYRYERHGEVKACVETWRIIFICIFFKWPIAPPFATSISARRGTRSSETELRWLRVAEGQTAYSCWGRWHSLSSKAVGRAAGWLEWAGKRLRGQMKQEGAPGRERRWGNSWG